MIQAAEILKDQQISLKNDHKAALRRQQAEHEADMEALKTQHHVLLVNERLEFNNTIGELRKLTQHNTMNKHYSVHFLLTRHLKEKFFFSKIINKYKED